MQDRYVGDVGDFAKYALLRRLVGGETGRAAGLGVVWCRFPDETHNRDGRHVSYLQRQEFEGLDDGLLRQLREIVASGRRQISAISQRGLLPEDTVFCDAWISSADGLPSSPRERLRHRDAWLEACLAVTARCNLVFFDPDNGLEIPSVQKAHIKAGKYVYWEELERFWQRGVSLLVYHHLNRTMPAMKQVGQVAELARTKLAGARPLPLVFRRGSCRVFWLLCPDSPFGRELEQRAVDFVQGGWAQHFRPIPWPDSALAPVPGPSRRPVRCPAR
jgi:hypothetical protein